MPIRRHAEQQQSQRRHRALGHRWADLPLRAKGLVVVAIPLVALVVAALLFGVALTQDRDAQGRVLHTVQVEHQVAEVRALALEAETGARGYLLTGQDHYREPYDLADRVLPSSVAQLGSLIRDNPSQVGRLERVRELADRRLQISAALIASQRPDRLPRSAISLLEQGKRTSDDLHGQLDAMQHEEQRSLLESPAGPSSWRATPNGSRAGSRYDRGCPAVTPSVPSGTAWNAPRCCSANESKPSATRSWPPSRPTRPRATTCRG